MCVRPRRAWIVAASVVVLLASASLSACAGTDPAPTPSPTSSPSAAPSDSAPSLPSGGVSLRSLGFANGPTDTFTVPLQAVVTDRVDQPNAVTVVMSSPSAAEIAAYYRRALPATGFTVTADDPDTDTLTFRGHGWTGALTGDAEATAVSLRPA